IIKQGLQKGLGRRTSAILCRRKEAVSRDLTQPQQTNEQNTRTSTHFTYDDDEDDEVFVLTAKQKQQLQRNEFLESLTKEQLKIEAKRRGQKTAGTKTELLQRLGYKMSLRHSSSLNNIRQSSGQMKISKSTPNGSLSSGGNNVEKERLRKEREGIKLWTHPILTIKYCVLESTTLFQIYKRSLLNHKKTIALVTLILIAFFTLWYIPGKHQIYVEWIRKNAFFVVYWVGLGVISSIGLGTGLHTFLLYLGPHIASVTLAAYECGSLDFPEPPYPNDIVCPDEPTNGFVPSLWSIMSKVRLESFLWGAGTALGELPPYFMARAARLSGYDPEDAEDLQEFEELQKKRELGEKLNLFEKLKLGMERIVERVGFFGILACASIPNPLFDLAGITCGHFLVPFWTFFGATLIGKAVIKMHLQKIVVIVAFSEHLIDKGVDLIAFIPVVGQKMQEPFKAFLTNQKEKLHRGKTLKHKGNVLQKVFEVFVIGMILYFILSIINSLAQSWHKRIHKKTSKKQRKIAKD
ncbi:CLUMA_CG006066, isoform A, partial [Clunio marinus]